MNPLRSVAEELGRRRNADHNLEVGPESGEKLENPFDIRLVFDGTTPARLVTCEADVLEQIIVSITIFVCGHCDQIWRNFATLAIF